MKRPTTTEQEHRQQLDARWERARRYAIRVMCPGIAFVVVLGLVPPTVVVGVLLLLLILPFGVLTFASFDGPRHPWDRRYRYSDEAGFVWREPTGR